MNSFLFRKRSFIVFGEYYVKRFSFFPFSVNVSTMPLVSRSSRTEIVYQGIDLLKSWHFLPDDFYYIICKLSKCFSFASLQALYNRGFKRLINGRSKISFSSCTWMRNDNFFLRSLWPLLIF